MYPKHLLFKHSSIAITGVTGSTSDSISPLSKNSLSRNMNFLNILVTLYNIKFGEKNFIPTYRIDTHTCNAKKEGVSLEELVEATFVVAGVESDGLIAVAEDLSEAVWVISALLTGGAYAHIANMIQSYG